MPIELYFGNRLEHLVEKLSDHLFAENRSLETVFEAPVVIVPNRNLAKWIQLTLARRESIFMNVDFRFLEAGLWAMIAALDRNGNKPEPLDSEKLKVILLYVLQHIDPTAGDLKPIVHYLSGAQGDDPARQAARIWQLTEKLTHLFQEYEYHRSGMIEMWNAGKTASSEMEKCQRYLYLKVNDLLSSYNEKTGKSIVSMMQYAQTVLGGPEPLPVPDADGKRVHFFGLSQISEFHLKLIGRLAPYYTLFIYALNPSREFWEDIKTPGEKKWIKKINVDSFQIQPEEIERGELLDDVDQPLLSAWGKPGRESVRMLCSLTHYDFNTCFSPDAPSPEVLRTLQNNILNLSDQKAEEQDRSLQITACPSIHREVETVYNSILYNLERDATLRLTDIAVLVPDMSPYKPVFDSVFNRHPRSISYNLVDANAEMESAYGQGVMAILKLARGRFSRKEVFELMMNPCFMSRWGIETDQVRIWASWADKLGIFHSFDKEDRTRRGYAQNDHYTWKQGLQRLRLGRLMTLPDTESGPSRFRHFKDLVPFGDIHTADADLVDSFCLMVEALFESVSQLSSIRRNGARWKQTFLTLCDRLLEIPDSLRGESAIKRSLIQAFDCLSIHDSLTDDLGRDSDTAPFDLALLTEFIKSHLGTISGGIGDYLTSGVTISALQPMRPIPFSIVYVLGMEEGNFPGRADTSSLDLRLIKRKIGDINTPERNCYLFLEILLAVRDKLYISYVSRDLQKDRLIQPCSVVNQLRRYVEQDILPDGKNFIITHIPLKGSSARYLDERERNRVSDVMVNFALSDRISRLRSDGNWDRFTKDASPENLKGVERFNPELSFTKKNTEDTSHQVKKITVTQLKKFLEDPVHQSIRYHLGMYDEEAAIEELALSEDEPFFSEFPVDYRLKTQPVELWVETRCNATKKREEDDDETADDLFDRVYDSFSRKSQVPDGAFSVPDRDELKGYVSKSLDALAPIADMIKGARERYRAVIIGEQGNEVFDATETLPLKRFAPVTVTVQAESTTGETIACEVEISGELPWLWKDEAGMWHVLVLTGSKAASVTPNRYALSPVLFCMLCLSGSDSSAWFEASAVTLHVLFKDKIQEWTFQLTKETSRDYLTGLVSDFLARTVSQWLPFETVTDLLPKSMKSFEDIDFIQTFQLELEGAYLETRDPMTLLLKPGLPAKAFDTAEKRLSPFLPMFSQIRQWLADSSIAEK
ncbi:MAG: exodeoxyribonuclease V subunit gamma [Pseudomonadota bacterium]